MSVPVEVEACFSLYSVPPKEAILAVVSNGIVEDKWISAVCRLKHCKIFE